MKILLRSSPVVIAIVVAVLWLALQERGDRPPGPGAPPPASGGGAVAAAAEQGAVSGDVDGEAGAPAPAARRAVAAATGLVVYPADRERGVLRGFVLDADFAPAAGVAVRVRPELGNAPPMLRIADDRTFEARIVTAADGRFEFEGLAEGPVRVTAARGDGERGAAIGVVGPAGARPPLQVLLQARGDQVHDLRVVVVDAGGAPVAGAAIELHGLTAGEPETMFVDWRRPTAPAATATTAADGVAVVDEVDFERGVAFARSADGRCGSAPVHYGRTARDRPREVRVEVDEPGALSGELVGVTPADVDAAFVVLHDLDAHLGAYVRATGRRLVAPVDGLRFAFADVPAGRYGLSLHGTAARMVVPPMPGCANSATWPGVEVAAGAVTEHALELVVGGSIEGRVTVDGAPVAGASVRAVLPPATSNVTAGFVLRGVHVWRLDGDQENAPRSPIATRLATTDAAGRYVLRGLQAGRHRVEVTAPGLSFDRRTDLGVADGEVVHLDHALRRAGVLQCAVLGSTYVGVVPRGASQALMIAVIRQDIATFPGLPAGHYTVTRFHSDSRVAPRPVREVEVVAGRTTWVDLRDDCVVSVATGRIRRGDEPAVGAVVGLAGESAVADAQGGFRIEAGFPLRFGVIGTKLTVRFGNVHYTCAPADAGPVTVADYDVQLGARMVDLRVVDAHGARLPARLFLSGEQPAGDRGLLRSIAIDGVDVTAAGPLLGPLPPWQITGTVVHADGMHQQIVVDADAERVTVTRPVTTQLRVRLLRDGQPVRGRQVYVATWCDDGPPPIEAETFFGRGRVQSAATDADGVAEMAVVPGEILIQVQPGEGRHDDVRRRLEASGTVELDLLLK